MMAKKSMTRDWDTLAREVGFQRFDDRVTTESGLESFGRADAEMILTDLMEYLPVDAAVLEIGYGIGRFLAPMCERFPEVCGWMSRARDRAGCEAARTTAWIAPDREQWEGRR